MIRVLHVITDSNIGGAGHQLLALFNNIDRSVFQMEVILPEESRLIPLLQAQGIPFIQAPHICDRSFSWPAVRTLYGLFKQKRPMLVHTHAALSARLAARLYGQCRIVHTRHSVFLASGAAKATAVQEDIKKPVSRWLSGLVNNYLSDAMIAVSPAAKDDLLQTGARAEKIQVIYNGCAAVKERTEAERKRLRDQYKVPEHAFVVAHIARLTEVKGHDDVLEAAKLLSHEPALLFLLAGDGPRQPHLAQRLADEGIGNVRLLGFIEAIDELENIMDVQINASFGTEATSLALLQGMSLGIPAVVSDYGGNPFVIEDGLNGLVVPTRDAEAFRNALLRLKNEPGLYKRLASGAKQVYRERFTADEMARQTGLLYERLLQKEKS